MSDPRLPRERVPGPKTDEACGRAPGRGRLAGRRILVVGAGTQPSRDPEAPIGNGRAMAVLFAREGAAVACADVDPDTARETARLVEKEGARAFVAVGDVSVEDDCARIVVESESALGGLDGVVLNVGIAAGSRLSRTTAEDWDRVFAVNLRAHFLVSRAALPRLSAGAALVFVSSVASLTPGTMSPAYDSSKAGIAGLMRHVAFEGARRGVRANVLVPGLIDTPLGRRATEGRPTRGEVPVPLQRQGTGWEVAYAALFLLSGESSYVTGQTLVVDGGLNGIG